MFAVNHIKSCHVNLLVANIKNSWAMQLNTYSAMKAGCALLQ